MFTLLCHQHLFPFTVLVDVCHLEPVDMKPHAQILGAQHIVEIGDGSKLLGGESAIEHIESMQAARLFLDVSLHESYVGSQILKKGAGKWLAQHRDAQMWVLLGQRVDHGHRHGHVSHRREPDD